MKRWLLIMFVFCAAVYAMVPRDRRAIPAEEQEKSTKVKNQTEFCSFNTVCAWSVYKPIAKIVYMSIVNTFCSCSPDSTCQIKEDDTAINAYVHRCVNNTRSSEES